jgi:8-oxo-dGTP pyrophosphatase MutT (NUDIX family)
MAGSSANWFRPTAGAVRGQKIFIRNATLQSLGMTRQQALQALEANDKTVFKAVANQTPLTGVARSKADARLKPGTDKKALASKRTGVEFRRGDSSADGNVLNGVPISHVSSRSWKRHRDKKINEPPWPKGKRAAGKRQATGVIVMEPDGRMWVYKPSMNYAGYENTFSGGGLEKGLSPQQNARKEAREEMGLDVEITGYLGDVTTKRDVRRYYIAKRKGGTPADATWEAESVRLIPPGEADDYLNKPLDKKLLAMMRQQKII